MAWVTEEEYQAGDEQAGSSEKEEDGAVEQVDFLVNADRNDAGQCREECRKQNRDEHIGGLGGSELGAVDHDADRYQCEPRRVEHQKHDHRVACRVFFRIQFLQAFHRFQSERRGRIVEPQHVCRKIHEDASGHGMAFGNIRKKFAEQRTQNA